MGFVLNELGQTAHARADYAAAQSHLEAAYALREKLDDASGMALDLSHLGQVALSRRELGEAQRLFERSLALYRDIGDQGGLVTALHGLGRTAAAEGRPVEAWGHLTQALEIANHANFVPVRLAILASLAEVLAESGAAERARRLAAAVISQPEYDHDARTRAECVLERLGSAPTSGRADAAEVDLASTIAAVLAEPLA
jgi:tetratricopeptide (TPR) repeat protein